MRKRNKKLNDFVIVLKEFEIENFIKNKVIAKKRKKMQNFVFRVRKNEIFFNFSFCI